MRITLPLMMLTLFLMSTLNQAPSVQTTTVGSAGDKKLFAVVTAQFSNEAHFIDLSVDPPILKTPVAVGNQPFDVATTPDNAKALVSNVWDSTLSVINLTAESPYVYATVPVTGNPQGLAVSPNGTIAIVGYLSSSHVSILDLTVDPPTIAYDVEISSVAPYAVGITPDGRYAIVGSGGEWSGMASVIDLAVVPPVEIYTIPIGRFPVGMAVDPTGKAAVITTIVDDNASIIDLTTSPFSLKATVSVGNNPGSEPDISSDGKYAVVANSDDDTVSIIDLTATIPTVVNTLNVGDDPRGVAIIEKDNVALVANRGSNTITKIDLNTLSVIGSFWAGSSPNRVDLAEIPISEKEFNLTILDSIGGSTNPPAGTYTYSNGTDVAVTATPDAYYVLDYWLLDDNNVGSSNPIFVLMTANHTLQPVFARINYSLTISVTMGGTTDPEPGTYVYASGSNVSVAAIPNANFIFDHWELDGNNIGTDNPIDIAVDSNHTLQAIFLYSFHDVAITEIRVSRTVVGQGYSVLINVTMANLGNYTETFKVTVHANVTAVESQNATLTSGNTTILTFTWNTTGWTKGYYAVWAYAEPVASEISTEDNTYTDGVVTVVMQGDVNADGIVDIFDITTVALAFNSKPGNSNWNPIADINNDGTVDIFDIVVVAIHFGETG